MQAPVNQGVLELADSTRGRSELYQKLSSFVAEHVFASRIERRIPQESHFEARAWSRSARGFTLTRIKSTLDAVRVQRDSAQICADGQDRYGLCLALAGEFEISQFGRDRRIVAGAYTMISGCEPCAFGSRKDSHSDSIIFLLPREFVEARVVCGERLCARANTPDNALNPLVFDSIRAFQQHAPAMDDDEFHKAADTLAHLALLSFNDATDLLSGHGAVRAANLARAKRVIHQRLSDPDLSLAMIAQECGFSLRYLHQLFKDDGCTTWEYLKGVRLQRARELLQLSSPDRKIIDLAVECGFSNRSYFSTAFRKAFGVSPQEMLLRMPPDATDAHHRRSRETH
jgi:AraC-like DNA-binding protein